MADRRVEQIFIEHEEWMSATGNSSPTYVQQTALASRIEALLLQVESESFQRGVRQAREDSLKVKGVPRKR